MYRGGGGLESCLFSTRLGPNSSIGGQYTRSSKGIGHPGVCAVHGSVTLSCQPCFWPEPTMTQASRIDVFQSDRGLQSCMAAANVNLTWATAFAKQHGVDTLEDFCYLVRSTEWERSLEDLVQATPGLKDNRIACARFKAAYETGMQAIRQASQVAKTGPEALDEPLPEATNAQLTKDFKAKYGLELDPFLDPCDALRARVYREFRKGTISVVDVRKVRSIVASSMPKSQDSVSLPGGLKLEFDRDLPMDITNAIQYYFGLRTLMYAWSWAGSYVTKDHDGKERCMAPLSVTQGYADESLRSCVEYGQGSLWWLQRNDQLTRGKVASLVRRGYTIASALPEALHNTHLEWRSPSLAPSLNEERQPKVRAPKREADPPPEPVAKRGRLVKSDAFSTISMLRGGKKICKPFNDGRGCQGQCQNAHVCDVKLGSGKACASTSHNRLNHPAE